MIKCYFIQTGYCDWKWSVQVPLLTSMLYVSLYPVVSTEISDWFVMLHAPPFYLLIVSIEEFIPLLRERMNVLNPYVRQFLVGWITVLDSVPDIDMLGFLPDFLDGKCISWRINIYVSIHLTCYIQHQCKPANHS